MYGLKIGAKIGNLDYEQTVENLLKLPMKVLTELATLLSLP
jgi:hypothetical protein